MSQFINFADEDFMKERGGLSRNVIPSDLKNRVDVKNKIWSNIFFVNAIDWQFFYFFLFGEGGVIGG